MGVLHSFRNGFHRFVRQKLRGSSSAFQTTPVSHTPNDGWQTNLKVFRPPPILNDRKGLLPPTPTVSENFDPMLTIRNIISGNEDAMTSHSITEQIETIREDIRSMRALVLTLYEHHCKYQLKGYDDRRVYRGEFDRSARILNSEYDKLGFETMEIKTRDDWLSRNLRICPIILYDMRAYFVERYQFLQQDALFDRVNRKDLEASRKQLFQECMMFVAKKGKCNFIDSYDAMVVGDYESTIEGFPTYPERLSYATCYLGLLMHFELILDGINRFDSLEDMKKWVEKKVEEGHIQCPFDGACEPLRNTDAGKLTYLLDGFKTLPEEFGHVF